MISQREDELVSDLRARIKFAEEDGVRGQAWEDVKKAAEAVIAVNPENILGNTSLVAACFKLLQHERVWHSTITVGVAASQKLLKFIQLKE